MSRILSLAVVAAMVFLASAGEAGAQVSPVARPQPPAPTPVSVYPNPASDRALVDLESVAGTAERVVVTDLRGTAWIEITVTAGQKTIELATADLANGVYVVTVTTSSTKGEAKLIVQH
jgi:hypothetical protein